MSQTFTDENLQTWEAYASTGDFGEAENPRIVFHCLSDPGQRARYVVRDAGDEADAEEDVHTFDEQRLRDLLRQSRPLE